MPVTITSDRIRLTDGSGVVKFDTDEGLFTALHFVSGSFSLSAVTASANSFGRTNVDATNTHTLETGLNASCTHVFGLYRSNWTLSGNFQAEQISGTRWRSANATSVDMMWHHACHHDTLTGSEVAADPIYPQGWSLYTFYLDGTTLKCKERIIMQSFVRQTGSTLNTCTRDAGSIDYRLYIGLFV